MDLSDREEVTLKDGCCHDDGMPGYDRRASRKRAIQKGGEVSFALARASEVRLAKSSTPVM